MPNAKVMAGSNRLKQTDPSPARPVAGHRGDLERRGPAGGSRSATSPRSSRPSTPRSSACRSSPRCSTRSAATVPTGVRPCEHVDLAAYAARARRGCRRRARSASTPHEPDVLARERAALRELLRLVAERAAAEAEVETSRALAATPRSTRNTPGLARACSRSSPRLEREARAADEQRRRAIVDAAIAGRGQGQGRVRRRQPQDRHRLRQRPRDGQERATTGPRATRPRPSRPASRRPPASTPRP